MVAIKPFSLNAFNFVLFVTVLLSIANLVSSAKILAIFPFPGPSQFICVKTYLQTLAAKGHDLTIVSLFPQKPKIQNIRDITLVYPTYDEVIRKAVNLRNDSRQFDFFMELFYNQTTNALDHSEVQELLHSKDAHFDLVIVEALLVDALYAFGPHFKAPLIGVSTFGSDPDIDSLVGNTSPISYVPLVTSSLTDRMDIWQRWENMQLIFEEWYHIQYHYLPKQKDLLKKHFPHVSMSLEEIRKNFSLILLNQHFSLSFARPYVPAMVEVAGMHINHKPSPLPSKLESFINDAPKGVIFFSLGSNVKSRDLPKEKLEAILKVFDSLEERIIWKFEQPDLPGKPDNVLVEKWLPQSDILAHPKVKLFITHAGLLSTIEAIHHAKPLVGIPVFYDQFLNMERAKLEGYGLGIGYDALNEQNFRSSIQEVLRNASYAEKIREISKRYHDRPMKPLDEAIYWTEYILRHKGARHMRVSGQDLSLIEYFNLDIFACLFGGSLLAVAVIIVLLKIVLNILSASEQEKSKRA